MPTDPKEQIMPLYHRDLGGEGVPPIVLLHGMLGSSRNWQTAGRELAVHRRVIAIDLRNHGLSPHCDDMSYGSMMADVLAWMDSLGLPEVELVGHSMGGKLAMLIACRHASRIARLVVVDIAPKDYNWPERREEFAAMNELDLHSLKSRAEAEIRFESRVPLWSMRKFLTTNLERKTDGGWGWQVNLGAITAALAELERNPLGPSDQFAGPALFIAGAKSGYIRSTDLGLIHQHFLLARLETISGSGHNPHIEARESLVSTILGIPR